MDLVANTTDKKRMLLATPLGPAFSAKEIKKADRMEIWRTFNGGTEDYLEFRLFSGEKQIAVRRVRA